MNSTTETLIEKLGLDGFSFSTPNVVNAYGYNAIMLLISNGFLETAKQAVIKGVKVNFISCNSETPLMILRNYILWVDQSQEIDPEQKKSIMEYGKDLLDTFQNYGPLKLSYTDIYNKTGETYLQELETVLKKYLNANPTPVPPQQPVTPN